MSLFLWPRSSYRFGAALQLTRATTRTIEGNLAQLFHGGHAVAVSSCRAGLALTLEVIGLGRPDLVQIPPYASHCVVEAVSRVAMPVTDGILAGYSARVIYHQWGYVQNHPASDSEIIEDACDTLCEPGARLFPLGGRFELWSLPKLLGCSSGGIIWCKDGNDAERLRVIRNARSTGATFHWLLRMLSTSFPMLGSYWAGRESSCGFVSRLAGADILSAIERWPDCVAMRRTRLSMLQPYLPPWLVATRNRLPCVVPVQADSDFESQISSLGITIGTRHFKRVMPDGSSMLVRMLPLPIHQNVSLEVLHRMLQLCHNRLCAAPAGKESCDFNN